MYLGMNYLRKKGTTSERPENPKEGRRYFDTTIGLPIWFDGTNWIDADGNIQ